MPYVKTRDGADIFVKDWGSGRPVVLSVELQESVVAMQAAEVTATQDGEVMNEMATVSARAFTVEETDRYAGSRGDHDDVPTGDGGGGGWWWRGGSRGEG